MDGWPARAKAAAVASGASFWFAVLYWSAGQSDLWPVAAFAAAAFGLALPLARRISGALDAAAAVHSAVFLGAVFVALISLYGMYMRLLRIDLLGRSEAGTYWRPREKHDPRRQY